MIKRVSSVRLLAVALAVAGCSSEGEDPAIPPPPAADQFDEAVLAALPPGTTNDLLTQGRELYVVCSVCHGQDGRGTQLGPSLRGPEWIHITGQVAEVENIVRQGIPAPEQYPIPMPVMGGGDFDEQEVKAVAAYVIALSQTP